jgi:Ca2+-binding RTX toxin-like protein
MRAAATVDLQNIVAQTGDAQGDTFTQIEGVIGIAGDDTIYGDDNPNTLQGRDGNDTLIGRGGADTLAGGNGNDTLVYDAAHTLQGGADTDTLRIGDADVVLDLTTVPDSRLTDLEKVDLTGTGDNDLVLNLNEVLALSSSTDELRVDGNSAIASSRWDHDSWAAAGTDVTGQYNVYTQATATLLIDTHVSFL